MMAFFKRNRERILFACILFVNVSLGCATIGSSLHIWNKFDGTYDCVTPTEGLTRIPGFEFTYQSNDECKLFPKEKVSVALNVFYLYWYSAFGDPADGVLRNLNNLIIEWKTEKIPFKNGYTLNGSFVSEGKALGLAIGKGLIQIYVEPGEEIWQTSFVHELVHVSINAAKGQGHGDPDHEGNKYQGWTKTHTLLMKEVNLALQGIADLEEGEYGEEDKEK